MHTEIDLLLSCKDIAIERIEGAVFIPNIGEKRYCQKHKQEVEIVKVGNPFWVDDENKEPITRVAGRYENK